MIKVNKKLQGYLDKLERKAWTKVTSRTSDDEFIDTIDAINQYCGFADAFGIDCIDLRVQISMLYTEFSRRVYAKRDIQDAYDLIMCLSRACDAAEPRPQIWINALIEKTLKAITAYRKSPKLNIYQYVSLLKIYAKHSYERAISDEAIAETKNVVTKHIKSVDAHTSDEELMYCVLARTAHVVEYWEPEYEADRKINDIIGLLVKRVKVRKLTDEQLLLWIKTAQAIQTWDLDFKEPFDGVLGEAYKELLRRESLANSLDVLSYEAEAEYAHLKLAAMQREVKKQDKAFKDEFLADVLSIKIDDSLSTEALLALQRIYLARRQSVSSELGERVGEIRDFCRRRNEEIYEILCKRISESSDINQKVRILNSIYTLESEYAIIGKGRDAEFFLRRTADALLMHRDSMDENIILNLLALKYLNVEDPAKVDEADYKLLQKGFERVRESINDVDRLYASMDYAAELQPATAHRLALSALGYTNGRYAMYRHDDACVYMWLMQKALAEKDKALLFSIADSFETYWALDYDYLNIDIRKIADMLNELAVSDDEKLAALAARKFVDGRYEEQLSYITDRESMKDRFDADDVVPLIKYLVEKSKRNSNSQITRLRSIVFDWIEAYFDFTIDWSDDDEDENDEYIMTHPVCEISTQSLIDILDVDLYLHEVDNTYTYAECDTCFNCLDVAHELVLRRDNGDQTAAQALISYDERIEKLAHTKA